MINTVFAVVLIYGRVRLKNRPFNWPGVLVEIPEDPRKRIKKSKIPKIFNWGFYRSRKM